jgi:hypothetical protein
MEQKTLKMHIYEIVLDTLKNNNNNRYKTAKALGVSIRSIRNYIAGMRRIGMIEKDEYLPGQNGRRFKIDISPEEFIDGLRLCNWSRTLYAKKNGRSFKNVFRLCAHFESLGYDIPEHKNSMKKDSKSYCKKCGRVSDSRDELCVKCS